mmetsp:Transcript_65024/g.130765  ORF Transcript_65024/g.130765 Transcript_65024/m.130765 type:complete len:231 (+) Transcript_65024:552-1244(+)
MFIIAAICSCSHAWWAAMAPFPAPSFDSNAWLATSSPASHDEGACWSAEVSDVSSSECSVEADEEVLSERDEDREPRCLSHIIASSSSWASSAFTATNSSRGCFVSSSSEQVTTPCSSISFRASRCALLSCLCCVFEGENTYAMLSGDGARSSLLSAPATQRAGSSLPFSVPSTTTEGGTVRVTTFFAGCNCAEVANAAPSTAARRVLGVRRGNGNCVLMAAAAAVARRR